MPITDHDVDWIFSVISTPAPSLAAAVGSLDSPRVPIWLLPSPAGPHAEFGTGWEARVDAAGLLLVAATADSGDTGLVSGAAAILGIAQDAAAPAEAQRLLRVGQRVEFRHPLFASAVYNGATSATRRRVHRAVAHALGRGTLEQTWHLAAATVGPG